MKVQPKLNDLVPLVTNSFTKYNPKITTMIMKQLQSNGHFKLMSLARTINKHFKETLYIFPTLKQVTRDYIAKVDAYFDHIMKQSTTCQIEEKFYILDVLETTNKIFASECRALFNNLRKQVNGSRLQNFGRKLFREIEYCIVREKRDNLNYVCEETNLCETYPAVSDYVAILLRDILKLTDKNFLGIVKILTEVVGSNTFFSDLILNKDVKLMIGKKFKSYIAENKTSDARNFFSTVREILTNRFNIFKGKDGKIKRRSKSVRILIEMVDKTYEMLGDHYIRVQSTIIRKTIKAWSKGKENDLQTTLKNYIDTFEDVLKSYWPPKLIKEARILIQVITMESAPIDEKYNHLFTVGSSIEIVLAQNFKFPDILNEV